MLDSVIFLLNCSYSSAKGLYIQFMFTYNWHVLKPLVDHQQISQDICSHISLDWPTVPTTRVSANIPWYLYKKEQISLLQKSMANEIFALPTFLLQKHWIIWEWYWPNHTDVITTHHSSGNPCFAQISIIEQREMRKVSFSQIPMVNSLAQSCMFSSPVYSISTLLLHKQGQGNTHQFWY